MALFKEKSKCDCTLKSFCFNYLKLCAKNVFKTVLGNAIPRNDGQMKVLGVFLNHEICK